MQVMNHETLAAHRAELAAVADPSAQGVVFDGFSERLKQFGAEFPDRACLFVGFGKTMYGMTADGGAAVVRRGDEEDGEVQIEEVTSSYRGWHVPAIGDDLHERTIAGSVPTNKMVGNVRIGAGVVLIVGKASTAKTPFAHALASYGGGDYAVIRYGEPLAGYCLDLDEVSRDIGLAMLHHKDIVLDSIKDVLAFAAGGAMSSGIQRGAFPILSDLSALAAERGCTIYVPLNPSNPDEKTVEMLVEAARSNVASVVFGEPGAAPGSGKWTFFTRRGEGLIRDTAQLGSSFDEGSLLMKIHAGSASSRGNRIQSPQHQVVTNSPLAGQAVDELMQATLLTFRKGLSK